MHHVHPGIERFDRGGITSQLREVGKVDSDDPLSFERFALSSENESELSIAFTNNSRAIAEPPAAGNFGS